MSELLLEPVVDDGEVVEDGEVAVELLGLDGVCVL